MARARVRVRAVLVAVLTLLAGTLVIAGGTASGAAATRVMPLGDSITGSPGCWRALLWNRLQEAGITEVDFVGTLPPQGCGVAHDGDNEGHGGALVTNVARQDQLVGWLAATRPDVVMMHFGTNDVWSNVPTATILDAYTTLVQQMRASNPAMRVLVAQIIPMAPATCGECAQRVVALNDAIPGWAAGISTAQSPVVVVDQWTGFSTAADTYDGVHPNASGDRKIADRWFPALAEILSGTQPTGEPTGEPTETPTVTPPPGDCTATYRIANQWQDGFQAEVTVTNTGSTAANGWRVSWTFADGQRITQIWNGTLAAGGPDVTVTHVGWNALLTPGASTAFGFLASWNGTNSTPTLSCSIS